MQRSGTLPLHMMHFGTTAWSDHGLKMALCRFIYGAIKEWLCYQRMLHAQYICIVDYSDYYYKGQGKKKHNRRLADLAHHPAWASCRFAAEWAFAWLNDCENGDAADVTFVPNIKIAKSLNIRLPTAPCVSKYYYYIILLSRRLFWNKQIKWTWLRTLYLYFTQESMRHLRVPIYFTLL